MDILKWPLNGPLPTQNPDTLLATHENRAKMLRAGLYARVERPTDAGNAEEAWKRGWSRAEKKVVMGDGAEWIWNLAALHFPGAVQIVDLYHARQHLWELARRLYPNDEVSQKAQIKAHQKRQLDKGRVEKLGVAIRSIHSTNPEVSDKIRTEADYFETNAERMRYPQLRRQHLFVGSDVIEAGGKTGIGSRLTQSGMFWTVRGANAILAHTLLPPQRPFRRLPGGTTCGLTLTSMPRTLSEWAAPHIGMCGKLHMQEVSNADEPCH